MSEDADIVRLPDRDDGPDTDFAAIEGGFVSITPLQTDLTRHSALDDVQGWLDGLSHA